jgi:hypothetical protein
VSEIAAQLEVTSQCHFDVRTGVFEHGGAHG